MRVLIVTGSYPPDPCGVGDYTASLHRHLAVDPRLDVAVLTSYGELTRSLPVDRAPVLRSMHGWGLGQMGRFVGVLKSWAPDVVHIQYPTQGYAGGWLPAVIPLLARLFGRAVVQTWHEPYSRSGGIRLLMQAAAGGGLVVVRPDYRELLHRSLHWAFLGKRFRYIRSASTLPACVLDSNERDALKQRLLKGQRRLIAFFGFVYPHKRVELLFELADPATDHIVIAGPVEQNTAYAAQIARLASEAPWTGKATLLGFTQASDGAALLAVADAVILPFQHGGGDWNTSIHAAASEGAFVLTTSRTLTGYDPVRNVYFARPDDVAEMKVALTTYSTSHHRRPPSRGADAWNAIACEHVELYRDLLAGRKRA